jgi:hypothetical protein
MHAHVNVRLLWMTVDDAALRHGCPPPGSTIAPRSTASVDSDTGPDQGFHQFSTEHPEPMTMTEQHLIEQTENEGRAFPWG